MTTPEEEKRHRIDVEVHRTHCCNIHGCKYGSEDCPVVDGVVEQDYPCEECSLESGEEWVAPAGVVKGPIKIDQERVIIDYNPDIKDVIISRAIPVGMSLMDLEEIMSKIETAIDRVLARYPEIPDSFEHELKVNIKKELGVLDEGRCE